MKIPVFSSHKRFSIYVLKREKFGFVSAQNPPFYPFQTRKFLNTQIRGFFKKFLTIGICPGHQLFFYQHPILKKIFSIFFFSFHKKKNPFILKPTLKIVIKKKNLFLGPFKTPIFLLFFPLKKKPSFVKTFRN
jgi:hypothetical protein